MFRGKNALKQRSGLEKKLPVDNDTIAAVMKETELDSHNEVIYSANMSKVRFRRPRKSSTAVRPSVDSMGGRFEKQVSVQPRKDDLQKFGTTSMQTSSYSPPVPPRNYPPSTTRIPPTQTETFDLVPRYMNQAAAVQDRISCKVNALISAMDEEHFSGDERELVDCSFPLQPSPQNLEETSRNLVSPTTRAQGTSIGTNYISKVWAYSNSRLPPHLPPFKVYMPTYPLLCLASQHSLLVYDTPIPNSSHPGAQHIHVPANWRLGTKATTLQTHTLDERSLIVISIRGSQSFMDWAVNFRPAPASPEGFLDDSGNLAHSGFLHVARAMLIPIAQRLQNWLRENENDYVKARNTSLLLTGHSAGGAVAALIYAHMLSRSESVSSELKNLTGLFKRVHCITFGAPPVTLLPLQTPPRNEGKPRTHKSLFFSFVNEGDPVCRAEMAFVRSLISLYASPIPVPVSVPIKASTTTAPSGKAQKESAPPLPPKAPVWPVPSCILSCAGRLVLLRSSKTPNPSLNMFSSHPKSNSSSNINLNQSQPTQIPPPPSTSKPNSNSNSIRKAKLSSSTSLSLLRPFKTSKDKDTNTNTSSTSKKPPKHQTLNHNLEPERIEALMTTDEQLRGAVFGDPLMHQMKMYQRRIEALAIGAVMGGGEGEAFMRS